MDTENKPDTLSRGMEGGGVYVRYSYRIKLEMKSQQT